MSTSIRLGLLLIALILVYFIACALIGSPKTWPYLRLQSDVRNNNIAAVERDLSNGVDPNNMPYENDNDEAALCIAAQNGNLAIMKLLLDHGANPNLRDGWEGEPLTAAADADNIAAMQLLIARGAEINDWSNNCNALWRAATRGKLSALKFLLQHGANPNTEENTGKMERVLKAAEYFNQVAAVSLLKKYGAKE
jgi:ankyrin repeat protein